MDTSKTQHKILIVEDEMIIAADISMQLTKLGYNVVGIQTRAEDAIQTIEINRPDIILMDIVLSGKMDGIAAAQHILNTTRVPVIFLTSNNDDATFQRALTAKPYAFIDKPFKKSDLSRGLEIALGHIASEQTVEKEVSQVSKLNDRLFIRQKNQMVKVNLSDIRYLEADRSYCKIHADNKEYLIATPLGSIEAELPTKNFLRVHRSYIVNIDKIDAISDNRELLTIKNTSIPISRRNREEVIKYLKLI